MAGMQRVLILGGQGYMGQNFQTLFPAALTPRLDIADRQAVSAALDAHRPELVINCAGKTGRPNVDWCETHRLETLHANVTGALVVMEECLQRDIYLVHLGSGCIYAGDNDGKGHTEDDLPNFAGSFYSRTKAWSDQVLHDFPVLNLRIRMPFDGTTSDRNLIMKLRKYPRVLTQGNSLTYLPELLQTAKALIERRATGTFNVVNEGLMSPFDVMCRYKAIVDSGHVFEPLTVERLGGVTQASRSNCLLSTAKLKALGLGLQPVEAAVDQALGELAGKLR